MERPTPSGPPATSKNASTVHPPLETRTLIPSSATMKPPSPTQTATTRATGPVVSSPRARWPHCADNERH
ncbi:hypothetical protein KEM55_008191 [Ascosphaera atra]|nr:hypothetical protein KEM55_008191 [Ascosphaera atra]